ncbi:helix-turn-helix domain-containing protein [Paenibacillus chartarius]|uniref:Helix-turn-helix domain-containing protein n=1 Tax=Paenibacillus chartarius TaxID=747481 RepID=A0ABV6DJH1_9BACL
MTGRTIPYYAKWAVFCFAITSLPVVLLGMFSYMHASGVVQRNVNEQKALSLAQLQTNIEQMLKTVDQTTTHFLSSSLVLSVMNEPLNPRQFTTANQLKAELGYLQRLDMGIADITMLSTAGGWLMNNNGLYRIGDEQKIYRERLEEPAPTFWQIRQAEGNRSAVHGCEMEIHLVKKLPLTAFKPTGLADITIPACSLGDTLTFDTEQELLLMLDRNRKVIWSQGLLTGQSSEISEKLTALTDRQGQSNLRLHGQEYTVTYRKSDYNDWMYVSAVPVAMLAEQSHHIGWVTLWICLILLLLFIGVSWAWSKRMYRPIQSLYREVLSEQGESDSGKRGDELSAIGERIHTLFKAQRELKGQLQGQLEQLKLFFMLKLLLGGMKESEIADGLASFAMPADFRCLAVMSVQIELEGSRFEDKDYDLLVFAVNNMIGELLPAGGRLEPIVLGRAQVTVMTSEQMEEQAFHDELLAVAYRIQSAVSEYLGLTVTIGLSCIYRRLGDIPRAYEEATEALRSKQRFGDQKVIEFSELGENRTLQYSYPLEQQNELFEAIKLVDRAQAQLQLRQLIEQLCRPDLSPYDRQYHVVRLVMNVLNLAHSFQLQQLVDRQQTLFEELFRLDVAKEGELWLQRTLVDPILRSLEERTEQRHVQLSRQMVEIVHNEFETDLSIEVCADRLHYNASYLSTVFRKSMNVPFSTYLAQHRHEVSKRWLAETNVSVKEISERLRYTNPQNFIRSFRKLEGMTPGKYREQHAAASKEKQGVKEEKGTCAVGVPHAHS